MLDRLVHCDSRGDKPVDGGINNLRTFAPKMFPCTEFF